MCEYDASMASADESLLLEQQGIAEARDSRFRRALEHGLEHSSGEGAMAAVVGALGTLIDNHDNASAFEMAQTAISALIYRSSRDENAVRRWHAVAAGCDPTQDAISVLDLAEEVDRAAYLYKISSQLISPSGAAAVAPFRQQLVQRFGDTVPPESALLDWLASRARGSLTTVGVVARIVHHGRLFGARGDDFDRTLKRVDRVVARSRKHLK